MKKYEVILQDLEKKIFNDIYKTTIFFQARMNFLLVMKVAVQPSDKL